MRQSKEKEKKMKQVQSTQPSISKKKKMQNFLHDIEDKMASLLDNEKISISIQKIPFTQKKHNQNQLKQKLKKIKFEQQAANKSLYQLESQEKQIKLKHRKNLLANKGINKDKDSSYFPSQNSLLRPKSELSQIDISLLKKLKKQHRQFQNRLEQKTRQYEQFVKKIKTEEKELKQQQIKESCQQRKKIIIKRMEQISKQKQQRDKSFEEQKKKLIEKKVKKRLFVDMEKNFKEQQQKMFQKKVEKFSEQHKIKQPVSSTIRLHEEKYRNRVAEMKLQKQKKREEFTQAQRVRKEEYLSIQKSKYYTSVLQTQKQKQLENLEKQKQKEKLKYAAKQYSEIVRKEKIPRIKTHSSQKIKSPQKKQGLTFQQTKNLGNKYFKHLQKMNEGKPVKKINKTIEIMTQSTKYKNYLSQYKTERYKEMKMKKINRTANQEENQQGIKNTKIRNNLHEIQKLIRSQKPKQLKFDRIKMIANTFQIDESRKGFDPNLVDKISAKIKILEELNQD